MSGKSTNDSRFVVPGIGQSSNVATLFRDFFHSFTQGLVPDDRLVSIVNMTEALQTEDAEAVVKSMTNEDKYKLCTMIRENVGRLDRELKGLHGLRLAALDLDAREDAISKPELEFKQSEKCADSLLQLAMSAEWGGLSGGERLERMSTCHEGVCIHWAGWLEPEEQIELSEAFVRLKKAFAKLDSTAVQRTDPSGFLIRIYQRIFDQSTDEDIISYMNMQTSVIRKTIWTSLPRDAGESQQNGLATRIALCEEQGKAELAKAINGALRTFRASDRVLGDVEQDSRYGFDTDAEYLTSLEEMHWESESD